MKHVNICFVEQLNGTCFNRVQFTNLSEGHDYFFRVFANGAGGLSEEPAEIKPAVRAKLPFGNTVFYLPVVRFSNTIE